MCVGEWPVSSEVILVILHSFALWTLVTHHLSPGSTVPSHNVDAEATLHVRGLPSSPMCIEVSSHLSVISIVKIYKEN